MPLALLYCPSRRPAAAYPWRVGHAAGGDVIQNAGVPTEVGRSDYAGNGGNTYSDPLEVFGAFRGPRDLAAFESAAAQEKIGALNGKANGIFFTCSEVRMSDVKDGTSNTLLIGEKNVEPSGYTDGWGDGGDNECALIGDNADISRWTRYPPWPDTPGLSVFNSFGSAHPSSFHVAMCDGSVHAISYTIEFSTWPDHPDLYHKWYPGVYQLLGNRKDELPIDGSKF